MKAAAAIWSLGALKQSDATIARLESDDGVKAPIKPVPVITQTPSHAAPLQEWIDVYNCNISTNIIIIIINIQIVKRVKLDCKNHTY